MLGPKKGTNSPYHHYPLSPEEGSEGEKAPRKGKFQKDQYRKRQSMKHKQNMNIT